MNMTSKIIAVINELILEKDKSHERSVNVVLIMCWAIRQLRQGGLQIVKAEEDRVNDAGNRSSLQRV